MDKVLQILGGLIVLAILAVAVPIGVAIAIDWSPEQTNVAMTGGFTVCGAGVAVLGLAIGVVGGIALMRDRKPASSDQPMQYIAPPQSQPYIIDQQPQAASAMDYLKQQKLMGDIERQRLALERDRRALAPPAPQQQDTWSLAAPGWVDAVGSGSGGDAWSSWSGDQ